VSFRSQARFPAFVVGLADIPDSIGQKSFVVATTSPPSLTIRFFLREMRLITVWYDVRLSSLCAFLAS
jgi:hypothetical protein